MQPGRTGVGHEDGPGMKPTALGTRLSANARKTQETESSLWRVARKEPRRGPSKCSLMSTHTGGRWSEPIDA